MFLLSPPAVMFLLVCCCRNVLLQPWSSSPEYLSGASEDDFRGFSRGDGVICYVMTVFSLFCV